MRDFTREDCDQTGYNFSLRDRIVVLPKSVLPADHPGQLFFCTGGNGANPNPMGRSVFLVSLSTGEQCRFFRSDIIGTLKQEPGLLSDEARLQLSQIRPSGSLDLKRNEPQYSGYCFLPDGRYTSGVWLCSPGEVMRFADIQKPYQHRVLICDRDDFAVMEFIDGQLLFPDTQALEQFQKEQNTDGGMRMT